jgi:hypothetical protein
MACNAPPQQGQLLSSTDQELELLDLGLRGVALDQNSIAFGPQRGDGRVLLSDDLRQLPQLLFRISWKLVQRQRHGAILLAAASESQR